MTRRKHEDETSGLADAEDRVRWGKHLILKGILVENCVHGTVH